jgi:hypothetical protein
VPEHEERAAAVGPGALEVGLDERYVAHVVAVVLDVAARSGRAAVSARVEGHDVVARAHERPRDVVVARAVLAVSVHQQDAPAPPLGGGRGPRLPVQAVCVEGLEQAAVVEDAVLVVVPAGRLEIGEVEGGERRLVEDVRSR